MAVLCVSLSQLRLPPACSGLSRSLCGGGLGLSTALLLSEAGEGGLDVSLCRRDPKHSKFEKKTRFMLSICSPTMILILTC